MRLGRALTRWRKWGPAASEIRRRRIVSAPRVPPLEPCRQVRHAAPILVGEGRRRPGVWEAGWRLTKKGTNGGGGLDLSKKKTGELGGDRLHPTSRSSFLILVPPLRSQDYKRTGHPSFFKRNESMPAMVLSLALGPPLAHRTPSGEAFLAISVGSSFDLPKRMQGAIMLAYPSFNQCLEGAPLHPCAPAASSGTAAGGGLGTAVRDRLQAPFVWRLPTGTGSWKRNMLANSASVRILIKGGKVVNDDCTHEADVYIENGIIQQVGRELMIPGGAKVIDATGKLVIPGGIDTSTHFHQTFMNATCVDDFYHGTKADGIEVFLQVKTCPLLNQRLQNRCLEDHVVTHHKSHSPAFVLSCRS
ncbi:hypothetical protein ACRRTK_015404 [Alexandromys fortis]